MIKNYSGGFLAGVVAVFLTLFVISCKKDNNQTPAPTGPQPIARLGLYKLASSDGTLKRVYIPVTKVGTSTGSWYSTFDTGSSGMTIDASGILPASMITANGLTVPGDSVVVNGITVTNQQATLTYGDANDETQEFGNLALAPITIGDKNGSYTTVRIPIFIYYKVVDLTTGKTLAAHSNDVFGVGPGNSFANLTIASPLSYIRSSATSTGFKLAALGTDGFTTHYVYAANLLSIGLLPTDFTSGNFIFHDLNSNRITGYTPNISATVSYDNQTINATVLFDTGTPSVSTIENTTASSTETQLPAGTLVTLSTRPGFTYSFTTASSTNLTQVANPNFTLDSRTIFSINFFESNEYLMDYVNDQIGLKNN